MGPVPPPLALEMAAVLACGEGAVISHHRAGAVHGFGVGRSSPIDVTVPSRSSRKRPGLRVHRATQLQPDEIVYKGGVPVTSPARTIFDLAAELTIKELHRSYENAVVNRLVRASELRSLIDRPRAGPAAPPPVR